LVCLTEVRADDRHSASICLFQADVIIKPILLYQHTTSAGLLNQRIADIGCHSYVNCIASNIGHIAFKLVVAQDHIGPVAWLIAFLTVGPVRTININGAAKQSDIMVKLVIHKDHCFIGVRDVEQRSPFELLVDGFQIIELLIRVKALVEEVLCLVGVRVTSPEGQLIIFKEYIQELAFRSHFILPLLDVVLGYVDIGNVD
jgi:hypothetical protein